MIPKKIAEESRALSEFLAMIEITNGEITAPMSIIIKHNVVARLLNWSGTLKEIALKMCMASQFQNLLQVQYIPLLAHRYFLHY